MKVIKDKEIIKKLTGYTRAHRGATRILSIVLCVAVIGTFVVWPSLADEMEPLGDEVEVAVNTPEPTGTPEAEATEEPAASQEPAADQEEEAQPEATKEPEASPQASEEPSTDGQSDEKDAESQPEETASAAPQKTETAAQSKAVKSSADSEDDTARQVEVPVITKQPTEGVVTPVELSYLNSELTLSMEAKEANSKKDIVFYQWYQASDSSGADATALGGEDGDTLHIESDQDAGTYYYFCRVYSVDRDDYDNHSDSVDSDVVKVQISPATPELSDFDLSEVKTSYYYTGKSITIPVTSDAKGMGEAKMYFTDANGRNAAFIKPGTYHMSIHVAAGKNYTEADIPLSQTVQIERINPVAGTSKKGYTVTGTKGSNSWYSSEVSIRSDIAGYQIGTSETGEFQDKIVISENGENVGPSEIYLKYVNAASPKDGAVSEPISVTDVINVDTTKPTGTITLDTNGNIFSNLLESITFGIYSSGVSGSITAKDSESGIESISYYIYKSTDKKGLSQSQFNRVSWTKGDTFTIKDSGNNYIVYAKLVDKAGNTQYISSDGIVLDGTEPVITSTEDKELQDQYIADRKTFEVSDTNLKRVIVYVGDDTSTNVEKDYSGDIENGKVSITLNAPGEADSLDENVYTIVAEDAAGNKTSQTITMIRPIAYVSFAPFTFEDVTYGYEEAQKEVSYTLNPANNVEVTITKLVIEEGSEYFQLTKDGMGVSLKTGLHASEQPYTASVRAYYQCGTYKYGTTAVTCSAKVNKKTATITYTGSTAKYNTIPVFKDCFQFDGLVNGDTEESLIQKDSAYVAPQISYVTESGTPKRADKTGKETLIPQGAAASDYEFQYVSGELTVERYAYPDRYKLVGTKGANDWYTSDVSLESADPAKYEIGTMEDPEDPDTFQKQDAIVYVNGNNNETAGGLIPCYMRDIQTGEISQLMTAGVKVDKTKPTVGVDEGIQVSDNHFYQFMNVITFRHFFKDTKEVSITASDDMSGVESIQYYISETGTLSEDEICGEGISWQEYTGKFNLTPDEYRKVVVYAKITNGAGLSTYVSSQGLVFDQEAPEIKADNYVTSWEEKDTPVYASDGEKIAVAANDTYLKSMTVYEGTDTTVSGTAVTVEEAEDEHVATWYASVDGYRAGEERSFTVKADDEAGNETIQTIKIAKTKYHIVPDKLTLDPVTYGYEECPQQEVTWNNADDANADATVTDVAVEDADHFEVVKKEGTYWISLKETGFSAGSYTTKVTITYNDGQTATTECKAAVEKATLDVTYKGQTTYYNEQISVMDAIAIEGFVNQDTEAIFDSEKNVLPEIAFSGTAKETVTLTPAGGKAENYQFAYHSGILIVNRREAKSGEDGQYTIEGTRSDTNWYTSEIKIQPKEGFLLLAKENDDDENAMERIVITADTAEGESDFFLKNIKTGEIYQQTKFQYKKDVLAPEILQVEDGVTYEVNTKEAIVKDTNLATVTVNGVQQQVENGLCRLTLTADEKNTIYVIVATDKAGLTVTKTVILKQPAAITTDNTNTNGSSNGSSSTKSTSSGTIKKSTKVQSGSPQTSISTKTADMYKAVLTDAEQKAVASGSDAKIQLRVKNIDSTVSQKDKELIIANLGNYTIGEYLDITLWKTVGSSDEIKVTKTWNPISVTITIPDSLKNKNDSVIRKYVVFRVHDGAVSIQEDQDSVENTVTINTDRFSTYVLAYQDVAKDTAGKSKAGASKSSMPATGDRAPLIPVVIVFVVAFAGVISVICLRRKKSGANK